MKNSLFVGSFTTTHFYPLFYLHNLQIDEDLYPANEQVVYLYCVWEANKFVLHEMINDSKNNELFMNVETIREELLQN